MSVTAGSLLVLFWSAFPATAPESYLGIHTAVPAFDDEDLVEDEGSSGGLTVVTVVENSPANQAGFRVGDRVLRLGGTTLRTPEHLEALVSELPVGSTVGVDVRRGAELLEIRATTVLRLIPHPAPQVTYFVEDRRFGLSFVSPSAKAASGEVAMPRAGIRIDRVFQGGPVDRAGLKSGDVILEVERKRIHGCRDFLAIVRDLEPAHLVKVRAAREGVRFTAWLRTFSPYSYLSRFYFPLVVKYESDPRKDETAFGCLLGIFKYERKESRSQYRILWVISFGTGTNEELEEVSP